MGLWCYYLIFFTLKRDHKDLKIWSSCNCDEPYASNVKWGGHRLRKSKNMTVNKIKLNYLRALVNENPLTFILSLQQQRPCKKRIDESAAYICVDLDRHSTPVFIEFVLLTQYGYIHNMPVT